MARTKLEKKSCFFLKMESWIGPLIVVESSCRMVATQSFDGTKHQTFNTFQTKPYYKSVPQQLFSFKSRVGEPPSIQAFISEVIQPHDWRAWKFDEARNMESDGLVEHGP